MLLLKAKKIFSVLSIIICLTLLFSTSVFAISEDELFIYDGIKFENKADIERYKELDDAEKSTFKENDDLIVLSISEETVSEMPSGSLSTLAVIKPTTMSGRIAVTTNSQRTSYYITLYVDWLRLPAVFMRDKIAVSWAGNSALLNSYCYYKDSANSYAQDPDALLAEVGNNSFVAYELNECHFGYMLRATISKANVSGLHNITGGYAHKRFGISGITVGVDSAKNLTFTASAVTTFDTMQPVYTTSRLGS